MKVEWIRGRLPRNDELAVVFERDCAPDSSNPKGDDGDGKYRVREGRFWIFHSVDGVVEARFRRPDGEYAPGVRFTGYFESRDPGKVLAWTPFEVPDPPEVEP